MFGEDLARYAASRETAVEDEVVGGANEPTRQRSQRGEDLSEGNEEAGLGMRRAHRKSQKRMQNLRRMDVALQQAEVKRRAI